MTSNTLHTSILDIYKVLSHWYAASREYGFTLIPLHCPSPRFGKSGSLVEWKWYHTVMVEASIHAPLIAIVSCKCPCTSSTPRGMSSPLKSQNMAYQPAFPHKASCQGFTNHMPWMCDCHDTLWAWSCWARPYWPQALQFWRCCWDGLNITNCIDWCAWVVLHMPHSKKIPHMGQSIALHPLMLALPYS